MRNALVPVLALLVALAAACAGPRLTAPPPTARLPAPVVRRVETPAPPTNGVPWPALPAAEASAFCDT